MLLRLFTLAVELLLNTTVPSDSISLWCPKEAADLHALQTDRSKTVVNFLINNYEMKKTHKKVWTGCTQTDTVEMNKTATKPLQPPLTVPIC